MLTFIRVHCLKVFEGVANEIGICPSPVASHRQVFGAVFLIVLKILGVKLMLHFGNEGRSGSVEVRPIDPIEEGVLL